MCLENIRECSVESGEGWKVFAEYPWKELRMLVSGDLSYNSRYSGRYLKTPGIYGEYATADYSYKESVWYTANRGKMANIETYRMAPTDYEPGFHIYKDMGGYCRTVPFSLSELNRYKLFVRKVRFKDAYIQNNYCYVARKMLILKEKEMYSDSFLMECTE